MNRSEFITVHTNQVRFTDGLTNQFMLFIFDKSAKFIIHPGYSTFAIQNSQANICEDCIGVALEITAISLFEIRLRGDAHILAAVVSPKLHYIFVACTQNCETKL